ncbi:MAG: polyamine aminopropyltransferase [Polyangiaceae bacterium]|nr:polyamine aminopropyltransferase [Polyangiaceae bacterium]
MTTPKAPPSWLVLAMILVIATTGLIYELVMAAVASYLLGDSVVQFSLVIGVYLSALGAGAYLSRFVEENLERVFVQVELACGLIGGLSAPLLFVAFAYAQAFGFVLYGLVLTVGILVGLELPIMLRLLKDTLDFRELISRALTFDYVGSLVGSLAFSLWLFPTLGLVQSSILCGALNALVGWFGARSLILEKKSQQRATLQALCVLCLLGAAAFWANPFMAMVESRFYRGQNLISTEQTAYQRIALTERGKVLNLHLNGNLQFSSEDEYIYHEALAHPALMYSAVHHSILIAGGGDGLALREVLKWPGVERVVLVDLDPRMTELFSSDPRLTGLNLRSLHDRRVTVVNEDAIIWLQQTNLRFDAAIVDFPDPTSYSLGKLYTEFFYRQLSSRLTPHGAFVVQATSPLFARKAYWCIVETLRAAGLQVLPYHAYVPSFGEWGFVLASAHPLEQHAPPPAQLRFLTPGTLTSLFEFPADMQAVAAVPNRLNTQALVHAYGSAWQGLN